MVENKEVVQHIIQILLIGAIENLLAILLFLLDLESAAVLHFLVVNIHHLVRKHPDISPEHGSEMFFCQIPIRLRQRPGVPRLVIR